MLVVLNDLINFVVDILDEDFHDEFPDENMYELNVFVKPVAVFFVAHIHFGTLAFERCEKLVDRFDQVEYQLVVVVGQVLALDHQFLDVV